MALTAKDKAWLKATLERAIDQALQDIFDGYAEAMGGYDGATEYKDDDWAEDGKRRVGFHTPDRRE